MYNGLESTLGREGTTSVYMSFNQLPSSTSLLSLNPEAL